MNPESTQLQQSQLAAILVPDPAPFETLISDLMSNSNDQRSHAGTLFSLCKQTDPNTLSLKLAQLLHSSPHQEARAMSATLLRTHLTRHHNDSNYLWPRLNPNTQSSLKSLLLSSLQAEPSKSVAKKLWDAVSELAVAIIPDEGWPEFFPVMFQYLSSYDSPEFQESAFLIFSQLLQPQCGWQWPSNLLDNNELFFSDIKQLDAIFLQGLTSTVSSGVQIAALNAVISYILLCLRLTFTEDLDPMFFNLSLDHCLPKDLSSAIMETLTKVLASGNEEFAVRKALELLRRLAVMDGMFLQKHKVVEVMLEIAENESLEEETRYLAIKLVMTLLGPGKMQLMVPVGEKVDVTGMMPKLPQLISRLFAILMKMLLDIEDEDEDEDEDELAGETINSVALQCLGRLANSFGGNTALHVTSMGYYDNSGNFKHINFNEAQKCLDSLNTSLGETTFFHVASEQLSAYLAASEWQKRHAAFIALAQITNGCSEVMMKNLEDVVAWVLNGVSDEHPRVKWAAINAIERLATGLGPDEQLLYLQHKVLPALDAALADSENPRIQSSAASAKRSLSEKCETPILKLCMDKILHKIIEEQETGKQMDFAIPLDSVAGSPTTYCVHGDNIDDNNLFQG